MKVSSIKRNSGIVKASKKAWYRPRSAFQYFIVLDMLPTVCVHCSPSNSTFLSARAASGPPFSIVLLCAVTGVAAIVMTAIAYRRDRHLKHSHLEVADFHFHFTPSSSVGHYVSSLRHKWRHLWNAPSSRRDNIRMDSYDRL